MDSKNNLLDNCSSPKEEQLIPKVEPIDVDYIKKEKNEDEGLFVVPGIIEAIKVDKDSIKEEVFENEEIENHSSSNVRTFTYSFIPYNSSLCYI